MEVGSVAWHVQQRYANALFQASGNTQPLLDAPRHVSTTAPATPTSAGGQTAGPAETAGAKQQPLLLAPFRPEAWPAIRTMGEAECHAANSLPLCSIAGKDPPVLTVQSSKGGKSKA